MDAKKRRLAALLVFVATFYLLRPDHRSRLQRRANSAEDSTDNKRRGYARNKLCSLGCLLFSIVMVKP
jgi:hypothetical protein